MRLLTPSSAHRKRKRAQRICVRHGCEKNAAKGYTSCVSHIYEHRNKCNKDNLRARKETLTHYGKIGQLRCCWFRCLVSDIDMLTLDHIRNNGSEERRINKHIVGVRLYRMLRRAGYPEGYQTLCANHQLKKELNRRRNNGS
jgi:hypothetical protein